MNCLKRSSVVAGAGPGARSYIGVALRLASMGAGIPKSVLEVLELLEYEDLLKFL